jgi:hypothetical protein
LKVQIIWNRLPKAAIQVRSSGIILFAKEL